MTQMVIKKAERLYNPARDVAHNMADVLNSVLSHVEDYPRAACGVLFPEEEDFDEVVFGDALKKYGEMLLAASDPKVKNQVEAVRMVGWDKVPPLYQMLISSLVGSALCGIAWTGRREAGHDSGMPRSLEMYRDCCKRALAIMTRKAEGE